VIEVYMEGHKGPDPEHPEILCDEEATEKLVNINKYNIILFSVSNYISICCRIVMLRR
jgi:hypothetical protein